MKRRVPFLCRFWHRWGPCGEASHLKACRRCGEVRWIDPEMEAEHRARLSGGDA